MVKIVYYSLVTTSNIVGYIYSNMITKTTNPQVNKLEPESKFWDFAQHKFISWMNLWWNNIVSLFAVSFPAPGISLRFLELVYNFVHRTLN